MFEVKCPQCLIFLRRDVTGSDDTGWETPNVPFESIKEFLDDDQLTAITQKLRQYPSLYSRWSREFIKLKQPNDKVGRYCSEATGKTALALVRDEVTIATFSATSNL